MPAETSLLRLEHLPTRQWFGAHAGCLGRVPAEGFRVELHQMQGMDSPSASWITLSRKGPITRVCWGQAPMVGRVGAARVFGA